MKISQLDTGLFRLVIVVLMMLWLVFFINKSYLKNRETIESVNFELEQQNFIKTVALINAQWLLEGRPSTVTFSFYDQGNKAGILREFAMSKFGWPSLLAANKASYCLDLWSVVINVDPAEAEKKILTRINYHKQDDIYCQICDGNQQDVCLTYSTKSGISSAE